MTYNPKKHHRRSIRLPEYDYTQPGVYFITLCTHQQQCWFGEIINDQMQPNKLGLIAAQFWQGLPKRFPHIQLDEFVVMPNHLHGIIVITEQPFQESQKEQFGKPVSGSIPTIIRSYKSAVTKRVNYMRSHKTPPIWQRNYYEIVIRFEKGLDKVREYIINNPRQWSEDEVNPNKQRDYVSIPLDLYF